MVRAGQPGVKNGDIRPADFGGADLPPTNGRNQPVPTGRRCDRKMAALYHAERLFALRGAGSRV
jgi:hypothetical protein